MAVLSVEKINTAVTALIEKEREEAVNEALKKFGHFGDCCDEPNTCLKCDGMDEAKRRGAVKALESVIKIIGKHSEGPSVNNDECCGDTILRGIRSLAARYAKGEGV